MRFLVRLLNRVSIKRKLIIIFLFCVLIPLIITDGLVIYAMINTEKKADMQQIENIADSAEYIIKDYTDFTFSVMNGIAGNKNVNAVSVAPYENVLDYYVRYYEILKNKLFSNDKCIVTLYPENAGIISGGNFQNRSKAIGTAWYDEFMDFCNDGYNAFDAKNTYLYIDFTRVYHVDKRVFSLVTEYDFYDDETESMGNNIIKADMNYSSILQYIENAKYSSNLYICYDGNIIFTNDKKGGASVPFNRVSEIDMDRVGYTGHMKLYDKTLDVYVMQNENITLKALKENAWLMFAVICFNILVPLTMFILMNRSFTVRLRELTTSFNSDSNETLTTISNIDGTDDISTLMNAYNSMAERINNLIENEYKEQLKRQEIDIAKQRAELQALHSQINPHFLFNALESIRMHSILKQENETARMVEKLAMMQRQNVEWGNDYITVENEIRLVEAYLELQKYRFGNKLMYEVSVDDECRDIRLPKITLVTFVENACVHSMEKKTSACWIFVRVSREYGQLVLEVEDTGNGIPEETCAKLTDDMKNVSMEMIRESKSIGILNAALRLKMFTDNRATFEIESESGVGTLITIKMPIVGENKIYGGNEDA